MMIAEYEVESMLLVACFQWADDVVEFTIMQSFGLEYPGKCPGKYVA